MLQYVKATKISKKVTQTKILLLQNLIQKTSVVDRPDFSTGYEKGENEGGEPTSVEGWKGLSLPPNKRAPGYYWRANPDFPLFLNCEKSKKLGVSKNSMNPSLKLSKVNKAHIPLSNTCKFDAPCQLFASAYGDSLTYRNITDQLKSDGSILDVAKAIATQGITAGTYNKRSSALLNCLKSEPIKGGAHRINIVQLSAQHS